MMEIKPEAIDMAPKAGADINPVILCGGSGTRLWPISRRDFAKQYAPILGDVSPFQRTLARLGESECFATPLIITSPTSRFVVADQAAATGVDIEIALEPEGRDTLAAVTLAALLIARRDPEAIALVAPSDHVIDDHAAFAAAAAKAAEAARAGDLVTFGITPTAPRTGFGYIAQGAEVSPGVHRVERFVEKPDRDRAAELIGEGALWNAGIFCFRADAALREIGEYAPEVLDAVSRALELGVTDLGAIRLHESFARTPKVSFDHGVMEKTKRAVVVEATFAWSDIGDWQEIWNQSPKDANGNVIEGDAIVTDGANNYVRASGRLVQVLGVEGLAVIDTPDALLIAPLDRTQEVKGLVSDLAEQGRPEASTPARVHRPWGWYQSMDLGERFRVKRIQVTPGKSLSLQKHFHRAEHWVVVKGTAEVTRDHEVLIVRENESIYLPLNCVHRLSNPGKLPVEIIEVQTGGYLEEDDIVRIEDDFGRS